MIRLTDDKGQEVSVEGDWSGRLVGQDFTAGGQILVWLKPGMGAWLEPVVAQPEIESGTPANDDFCQGDLY